MLTNDHLTAEDSAIIAGLHNARALNQRWDSVDYRAMMAREVWREESWRANSVRMSAADLTRGDELLREEDGTVLIRLSPKETL